MGAREAAAPLPTVTPLIHSSKGVEMFDISGKDNSIPQEELDAASAKFKAKEADALKCSTPSVGVMNLTAWQFETISLVAAASTSPNLVVRWMNQIATANSWEELDDPLKTNLIKIWTILTYKWQLQILFNLPFLIWWAIDKSFPKVHEFDARILNYLNLPEWALSFIGFGQ